MNKKPLKSITLGLALLMTLTVTACQPKEK